MLKNILTLLFIFININMLLGQPDIFYKVKAKFIKDKQSYNDFAVTGMIYYLDKLYIDREIYNNEYIDNYNSCSPFFRLIKREKLDSTYFEIYKNIKIKIAKSQKQDIKIAYNTFFRSKTTKKMYVKLVSDYDNYNHEYYMYNHYLSGYYIRIRTD